MSDRIAVINDTTILTDVDVRAMVVACQTQISRDFAPAWGSSATLRFVPRGRKPPLGWWWLAMTDDADAAGALGYHDITPDGQPLGKVFARTTQQYGEAVPVTLSHELLEMLADPDVNLLVQDGADSTLLWAYETCDAVQEQTYAVNGVAVSNFVLPAYFQTFRTTGPFDFLKSLTAPVPALTPGGYMAYVKNGSWGQVFGTKNPTPEAAWRARPHAGARRLRRRFGRAAWIVSTREAEREEAA